MAKFTYNRATVAFIFASRDGTFRVRTLGYLPINDHVWCGGDFETESAASAFLKFHGFKRNAAGSWER